MKILRVKKTAMFDVFVGAGWEQWSRVLFHKNKTILIGGEKLSSLDHLMVHRQLKKLFPHASTVKNPARAPAQAQAAA